MFSLFASIVLLAALPSSQTPSNTSPNSSSQDVCANLTNPDHKTFATQLTGKERILFCSVFDDVMRDKAISYTKKTPKLSPQEAVTQVGKESGLLFNPTPGGACPTG